MKTKSEYPRQNSPTVLTGANFLRIRLLAADRDLKAFEYLYRGEPTLKDVCAAVSSARQTVQLRIAELQRRMADR